MPVRMTHPLHGVHHAVGAEVEWNIANGWKVDPGKPAVASVPAPAADPVPEQTGEELEAAREKWRDKWGREPDLRKSAKTLLREAQ